MVLTYQDCLVNKTDSTSLRPKQTPMVPVLDIECSKKGTSEVHVYYKDGIINSDDLLTKTVMSIIILFLTETMEIVARYDKINISRIKYLI